MKTPEVLLSTLRAWCAEHGFEWPEDATVTLCPHDQWPDATVHLHGVFVDESNLRPGLSHKFFPKTVEREDAFWVVWSSLGGVKCRAHLDAMPNAAEEPVEAKA